MKKLLKVIVPLFLSVFPAWAQPTVPTRATFVVRDDRGQPVPKALIEGGFYDITDYGARNEFRKFTDTNGMLVVKGRAMIGVGGLVTAEGFYQTTARVALDYDQLISLRRWDVEVPVLLKRIRNPIPMYVREVSNFKMRDRSDDKWGRYALSSLVSYDLLVGDMVAPYGKGKDSDLEFNWKMTILSTYEGGGVKDGDTI